MHNTCMDYSWAPQMAKLNFMTLRRIWLNALGANLNSYFFMVMALVTFLIDINR